MRQRTAFLDSLSFTYVNVAKTDYVSLLFISNQSNNGAEKQEKHHKTFFFFVFSIFALHHLYQWLSNFSVWIPPKKILGSWSTTSVMDYIMKM